MADTLRREPRSFVLTATFWLVSSRWSYAGFALLDAKLINYETRRFQQARRTGHRSGSANFTCRPSSRPAANHTPQSLA
jgi:hypothetical protein